LVGELRGPRKKSKDSRETITTPDHPCVGIDESYSIEYQRGMSKTPLRNNEKHRAAFALKACKAPA